MGPGLDANSVPTRQPKPCLSPRKGPAGTGPTQQLQRWGMVGTWEGPGLKAICPQGVLED